MRSRRLPAVLLFSALLVTVPHLLPGAAIDDLRISIERAQKTGDPVEWAKYLMQADTAAEKLQRSKPAACCGNRCLRMGSFQLNYRYNDIEGQEDYQHDLLKLIAQVHEGTPDGAEALVRLLPTGCQTIATSWTPYFKTVLSILELTRWKKLPEPHLIRIRAEAYETWWSLSKASPKDPILEDAGLTPDDFADGADQARLRAIEGYRKLTNSGKANAGIRERLRLLEAGKDTDQRTWVCAGD